MKNKTVQIIMWIVSVACALLVLFGLIAGSWAAILLIIPAALFNPKINDLLLEKFNFKSKWWINTIYALLAFIVIGVTTPTPKSVTVRPDLSKNQTSASSIISSSVSSSQVSSSVQSSSAASQAAESIASQPIKSVVQAAAITGKLKVHYLDVGQGDSEFIELPTGQTILIDAGNPENGTQIVNYIKGLNHSKIDYLIATHPHADHIGGMATVVNGLAIGKIYMPKKSTNIKTFEDLITTIKSKGLTVNTAQAGVNILKTGNLNIDILAPVNISGDDLNQYSAVIKITYGDNKFLFMGDAGEMSESQITADVKADVLKVGHHGSNTATSQAFLNKVSPKHAVIEVGKGNSYGHPTAATLSKLQNIGATVYRTDNDGTIIFTSDAKTITIDKKSSSIKQQAPPVATPKSTAPTTTPKSPLSTTSKVIIAAPSTDNQNMTVYITTNGSKYHTESCRTLKKSKIAISLKDAKAKGYTACGICHPPQ
jgi:competence protein ComEC